jgi:hypothetical protein
MMKSPIDCTHGTASWESKGGDKYLVVGKDCVGQRVRIEGTNWAYINGINIWQGNKYLIRNGKRYPIQRITN